MIAEEVATRFVKCPVEARQKEVTQEATSGAILLKQLDLHSISAISERCLKDFVDTLLEDLAGQECAWTHDTRLHALAMIKELSRSASASRVLVARANVEHLVTIVAWKYAKPTAASESSADLDARAMEQKDLALRTLSNVMLQHSDARSVLSCDCKGINAALQILESCPSPMMTFLAARLVFFATLQESVSLKEAVERANLVSIFVQSLTDLLDQSPSPDLNSAIAELFKAFFNVSLFYPRMTAKTPSSEGNEFDDVLLPFLPPTVASIIKLPKSSRMPLASPFTNAIAVLLNFPVKAHRMLWGNGTESRPPSRASSADSIHTVVTAADRAKKIAAKMFRQNLKSKATILSHASDDAPSPPIVHALIELLDGSCSRLFGRDKIDAARVEERAQADGTEVEHSLEPAILLLRKLADEVDDYRLVIKSRILPKNIDRKQGLDQRPDLTGILIRLMSSIDFPRLARASGELFLALCDGKPTQMTAEIGYGPCAGFLVSIGRADVLPQGEGLGADDKSSSPNETRVVDPITGKYLPSQEELRRQDAESGFASMTEEEKEAEAERLFGLFDRMDKTGIIKIGGDQHPMRQAVNSGKIKELDDADEQAELERLNLEDAADEAQVEQEMGKYRARKERG